MYPIFQRNLQAKMTIIGSTDYESIFKDAHSAMIIEKYVLIIPLIKDIHCLFMIKFSKSLDNYLEYASLISQVLLQLQLK